MSQDIISCLVSINDCTMKQTTQQVKDFLSAMLTFSILAGVDYLNGANFTTLHRAITCEKMYKKESNFYEI